MRLMASRFRVIAADRANGNFGMGSAQYPVLSERLRPKKN